MELFNIPSNNELQSQIEQILESVSNPNHPSIIPTDYPESAFSIYKTIWKPIEKSIV